MKLIGIVAGVAATAAVVSGCSASSSGPTSSKSGGKVVNGATFTMSSVADPGNLDPQGSAVSGNIQQAMFAYDSLLNLTDKGTVQSGLAATWKVTGAQVLLTLRKSITCSDGAPFTAADAAANINYVADAKNKSPLLGVYLPVGAKATADTAAGTVTMTSPKAAPFVLDGLANVPMVCANGMKNRKSLAQHTNGTGPYQLTQVASGDHYTYTKRSGYAWGPNGATTATAGTPAKVVIKIVSNETTAANLLLSGGLNAAGIIGPDVARVEGARLFSASSEAVAGEMWFNQAKGRPGAEEPVRQALTTALDLKQLAKVVTSGRGRQGTTFATVAPAACPGNSIDAGLPTHDLAKAKTLLDGAGWRVGSGGIRSKGGKPLTMHFVYNTSGGSATAAGAELAAATWKKLGIKLTTTPQDETALSTTLFSTGDYDVIWAPVNVSSPDQIVPFLSGPVPPAGTNFAHIANPAYDALVAKASVKTGAAGCPEWLQAETELVKSADVIPFADQVLKIFGRNATFSLSGAVVPTSIRMLAS